MRKQTTIITKLDETNSGEIQIEGVYLYQVNVKLFRKYH